MQSQNQNQALTQFQCFNIHYKCHPLGEQGRGRIRHRKHVGASMEYGAVAWDDNIEFLWVHSLPICLRRYDVFRSPRIVFKYPKKLNHLEQSESDLLSLSELPLLLEHKRLNNRHMLMKTEVLTAVLMKVQICCHVTSVERQKVTDILEMQNASTFMIKQLTQVTKAFCTSKHTLTQSWKTSKNVTK
jgi:hypothetical protein